MPSLTPLRILFLHGFTQNPNLFLAKTAALRKALSKAFPPQNYVLHFSYPRGPHRLSASQIPGFDPSTLDTSTEDEPEAYAWWVRRDVEDGSGKGSGAEVIYEGLEKSMDVIADHIHKEGPFDGVVGFSQGAAAAAIVASLLEGPERFQAFEAKSHASATEGMQYPRSLLDAGRDGANFVQPPLKFAVCYSGFRAPNTPRYSALYEPHIKTPVLHVLGQVDVVVEEARARALIDVCEGGARNTVVHPGGHFVPSQKPWLDAAVGFVKTCIDGGHAKETGNVKEECVEDMDVPF